MHFYIHIHIYLFPLVDRDLSYIYMHVNVATSITLSRFTEHIWLQPHFIFTKISSRKILCAVWFSKNQNSPLSTLQNKHLSNWFVNHCNESLILITISVLFKVLSFFKEISVFLFPEIKLLIAFNIIINLAKIKK